MLQDGGAVAATSEQVKGNAVDLQMGFDRSYIEVFTHLIGFQQPIGYTAGTFDVPGEQMQGRMAGAGTEIKGTSASAFRTGSASMSTGTTTTGSCGIQFPGLVGLVFDSTVPHECRIIAALPTAPSGAQDFVASVGLISFITATPVVPTLGWFFRASTANANWQAVSKNGASETVTNSSVSVTAAWPTFRINYDIASNEARFYINGTLVVAHTTNHPAFLSQIHCGASIVKSAGSTARLLNVDAFYYKTSASAGNQHL